PLRVELELASRGAEPSHGSVGVAIAKQHRGVVGPGELDCLLEHDLEDGSEIGLRSADHPQHFVRRRLLLERLLRLVEQAGVLDGDGGLMSEGLDEVDMALTERTLAESSEDDHSPDPAV